MHVYPTFRNLYRDGKLENIYEKQQGEWRRCGVETQRQKHMHGPTVYRRCYDKASLYPQNLSAAFAGTPWQYKISIIKKVAQSQPFYVYDTLKGLARYPQAEYLLKAGLYNLGQALLLGQEKYSDFTQKRPYRFLKLQSGRYVPTLVQMNADTNILGCIQEIDALGSKVRGGMLAPDVLREFVDKAGFYAEELVEYFAYATPYKVLRYVKSICKGDIGIWIDYLRFCKALGRDLSNDFVLFPKNPRERHDELAKLLKNKRQELADAYIQEQWANRRDVWGWSSGGFFIRLPRCAQEVLDEGDRQKHCVGGYLDRIYERKTVILFLRREQEPDKPFYTVEYANGRIMQYRGFRNNPVAGYEIAVEKFIRRYQETINRRLGKERRLQSAA